MSSPDKIQRILFDDLDVRGVVTGLQESYQSVLSRNSYPASIQTLLGEMMAAVTLLSSTLKFEGRLILQAQGTGAVRMLMAECTHHQQVRAVARIDGDVPDVTSLAQLLEDGRLALTLEPAGGQRYQGVVGLEGETLAKCLEIYFKQSEQLATRIYLQADGQQASGLLLQMLPSAKASVDDWERITFLAGTLSADELLSLDNETLLYRLFHEEACRLFEAQTLAFYCDCSRERSENALKLLAESDLLDAAAEESDGVLKVDCQFCNERYLFTQTDIKSLFAESSQEGGAGDSVLH
ncbi:MULTISPECIES: Hsp33 family molecular chaperone HslO [Nitrincola]|uniref:33 kDa chaperonin n=1 Tax=Nitrincola nitratireducens TaxID=1229521 RepID=W9V0N7_9GAMM|nr:MULTISPECIES: Hsp33 family molecular chaperone HslO [Nitrincola]EXJ10521.1 Heat shock protein 33 [Nitrincola nitratireducens]